LLLESLRVSGEKIWPTTDIRNPERARAPAEAQSCPQEYHASRSQTLQDSKTGLKISIQV